MIMMIITLLSGHNDQDDNQDKNQCNDDHDDHHPLVRLLEGEDEGVDVSQVVFEEVHQLVYVRLLQYDQNDI